MMRGQIKRDLARLTVVKALTVRQNAGCGLLESISVYDVAKRIGFDVRFDALPSLEGMYVDLNTPTIILSCLRPSRRARYTCAHEIGHHVFGHGLRVDTFEQAQREVKSHEEFLAECFAGFLLMPKSAVIDGFGRRGWDVGEHRPEQFYTVAGWLRVGYTTLITHMSLSLGLLHRDEMTKLRRVSPKQIRSRLVKHAAETDLIVVDENWVGRPVDLQIGDYVLLEGQIEVDSTCLERVKDEAEKRVFRAAHPGVGQATSADHTWAQFVRVSRRDYVGWTDYMHLEDPDHDS